MADENLRIKITAIDKTRQAFSAISNRVRSLGTVLLVAGAAAAAFFGKMASSIDKLAKTSSRLGIAVSELQSLQYAAGLAGASAEDVNKGMQRFARSISEASTGIGTARNSFAALNISLTDQNGNLRDNQEILQEVIDRFSDIKNPADRIRVAFDLFGRSGEKLVNLLSQGGTAVAETRKEFEALSFHLSNEQAAAVEAANDQFSRLGTFFSSTAQVATAFLLPALAKIATFIVTTYLRAFNLAIEAARTLVNAFISSYNKVRGLFEDGFVPVPPVDFGVERQKEIQEAIKALNQYGEARKEANKDLVVGINPEINDRLRNMKELVKDTVPALQDFRDKAADTFTQLNDVGVSAMGGLEDALVGIVKGTETAKDAFKNMVNAILDDLLRLVIRQQITGPIAGILNTALGSFFGPGSSNPAASIPQGPVVAGYADGGVTSSNRPYMVGERGPELFMPGVTGRVVPTNKAFGGNDVTVNVINNSGAEARTEERTGPGGAKSIDVIIDETVARNISTPGSRTGRALRSSFAGLSPQLAGR